MSGGAEQLAARLGPIEGVEEIHVDGLRRLVHGAGFTAIEAAPSRVQAERAGLAAGHPLAPRWLASTEHAWAIDRLVGPVSDPLDVALAHVALDAPRIRREGRLDALLGLAEPRADRALLGLGVPRRRVDRVLARALAFDVPIGPSLGGALPGWFWRSRTNGVCLSVRRARADGEPLDDLAALELGGVSLGDRWGDGHALDVARLRIALREAVLGPREGRDAAGASALEVFERFEHREPDRVALEVDAPACLDLSRYAPLGADVPASHARFVLRALDGVIVAGQAVRVRVHPPVRAGRSGRPFEERGARLLRLFGHEGARFDEEGLYSATPVALAREVVRGLRGVVIDGTCGVGCLAIAAAERPDVQRVLAVDIDPERLAQAGHLARLRGVAAKMEFRAADVRDVVRSHGADALLLDPPWGGRDYDRGAVSLGDLALDVRPLIETFRGALRLKLPRGTRDVPASLTRRAIVDERGAVKFLLASRG